MRGYTLLECICSLTIVALLTAGVTQITHRATAILGATSDALEQRFAITKTATALSAALAALERTHIPGVALVTDGSNPTTPHGSAHPAAGLAGNTRPRANSAILSVVEVEPRYRARIVRSSFSGKSLSIDVCGVAEIPGPHTYRSHLAVGLSHICQVTGAPQRLSDNCFTLSGGLISGMLSSTCPPQSMLEYLPVVREQSLYIDRTGEFRLISHVGARIIENQPIVRGLRSLEIRAMQPTIDTLIFRFDIHASATRSHRFLFTGALTREELWNEVLL
jgi:prepilin-type N-terminal cleavage/methylation domain-containing protein